VLKYSKRVSAIILSIILVGFSFAQDVYSEPDNPIQGGQVTIYYNLEDRGILPTSTNPCYIHLGYNGWSNTNDYAMIKNVSGYWEYELSIPQNTTIIDFAFTDNIIDYSAGTWDNNGGVGVDWHIDVYPEGLSVVAVNPEVSIPFGHPLRSPAFVKEGETLQIELTTVSNGAPSDTLFLIINGNHVSNTTDDTLKFDFDSAAYPPDEYLLNGIAKDVNGISDSLEFAIVVRPEQVSIAPPNYVKPGINHMDNLGYYTDIVALLAPYKDFVYVICEMNDWKVSNNLLMNKYEVSPDSVLWWKEIPDGHGQLFQYLVDGDIRIADPYSELVLDPWNDKHISETTYPDIPQYPEGKTTEIVSVFLYDLYPVLLRKPSDDLNKPEQKDLVIYELLIRDFVENHDYKTLIDTLDYLENLGINAIELMPINEFEGNSSWGYNPSFYFALDKYYGPKDDLKAFIDECHRRGITVIQDIVLNHSYSQSPLARLYWDSENNRPAEDNLWYNKKSPNPVFSWGYDFNHESKHTKYFFDRVLRYWIEEYNIDGFRLDFTKGLTNKGGDGGPYDASRIAILKRLADEVWSHDSTSYLILEHFADNVEEKELADYGFMLWGNTNHNYNEATMGYNSNSKSDFSWGFFKSRGWTKPHLVTYMESHDEERLMYKNLQFGNSTAGYNIKDLSTAIDRQKIAAVFYFTLPGPKMIWQFGELGYDYSINYDGRLGEKPIRWDYFDDPDRRELYDVYSRLINIRNKNEVFTDPQTSVELSLNNSNGLKRISLSHSSMSVIIIGNFGVITQSINPNFHYSSTWYDDINADSLVVTDTQSLIELEPGEFKIFSNKHFVGYEPEPIDPPTINYQLELYQNFPNPFNLGTSIKYSIPSSDSTKNELVQLKIYNILGQEIEGLVNEIKPPGEYLIHFSSKVRNLSNGVYFYTLSYCDKVLTKKMLLLK